MRRMGDGIRPSASSPAKCAFVEIRASSAPSRLAQRRAGHKRFRLSSTSCGEPLGRRLPPGPPSNPRRRRPRGRNRGPRPWRARSCKRTRSRSPARGRASDGNGLGVHSTPGRLRLAPLLAGGFGATWTYIACLVAAMRTRGRDGCHARRPAPLRSWHESRARRSSPHAHFPRGRAEGFGQQRGFAHDGHANDLPMRSSYACELGCPRGANEGNANALSALRGWRY